MFSMNMKWPLAINIGTLIGIDKWALQCEKFNQIKINISFGVPVFRDLSDGHVLLQ